MTVVRYRGNPRRLAVNILDETAQTQPNKLFAEVPISPTSYDEGFEKITFRSMANAVNAVAWWLTDIMGAGKDFQTLSYIGPNDLGHVALLLGAVKAGYKVSFKIPEFHV